ncbi:YjgN family protein [Rhodoferax sp. WC2427]|uniref:YjgN family protein n=1 Tax=Rhodoferax sp. WC2427 TaxID=3234144 RepID=UPI003467925B
MTEPHFADTLPMALPAAKPTAVTTTDTTTVTAPAPPAAAADPVATAHPLDIVFTGSGSEYFRIWIVNLLLTLVTFGIYYPWAKVRRLRYFYGNTLVDGAALDFHGNPRKMLKGSALVAVLFGLYSLAGQFSPVAGLVALVLVALIAPALVRASMQFRLAHTSWRGLRFRFTGSMPEVYRAVLPLYVPAVLIVGFMAFAAPEPGKAPNTTAFVVALLGLLVLTMAMQPWTFWKLKQYQHDHYAFATVQARFTATPWGFYKLTLKVCGFALLAIALPVAAIAVMVFTAPSPQQGLRGLAPVAALLPFLLMLLVLVAVKPYAVSRTQNLVWDHTRNHDLQFHSALRFVPLLWLTLKNWLLVLLTLGLYWPFAAIAMARIRLQAVSIATRVAPDTLVGQRPHGSNEAAGDAAGDMLGFDLGL